jgi:hypothetical protein
MAVSTSTTYLYDLLLRLSLQPASTACLYGLPLRPASTACLDGLPLPPASTSCLYRLPLRLRSASTACLHHAVFIIIILIVHFLFKRNIYFSLLYVIHVFFPSSLLEITFLFFF